MLLTLWVVKLHSHITCLQSPRVGSLKSTANIMGKICWPHSVSSILLSSSEKAGWEQWRRYGLSEGSYWWDMVPDFTMTIWMFSSQTSGEWSKRMTARIYCGIYKWHHHCKTQTCFCINLFLSIQPCRIPVQNPLLRTLVCNVVLLRACWRPTHIAWIPFT